jgi:hypothetical protein
MQCRPASAGDRLQRATRLNDANPGFPLPSASARTQYPFHPKGEAWDRLLLRPHMTLPRPALH